MHGDAHNSLRIPSPTRSLSLTPLFGPGGVKATGWLASKSGGYLCAGTVAHHVVRTLAVPIVACS